MKIKKSFIGIFIITFFISYGFVIKTEKEVVAQIVTSTMGKMPTSPVEAKKEQKPSEEAVEWQEDSTKFSIKLIEADEGFHGDEIKAKSGEIWLGLFKEKDEYFLRSTKITVLPAHDDIVDDENEMTGKIVFTDYKASSVFLLKNAKMLREDKIETLFYAADVGETTELKNGSQKNFEFNGENYNLRVENKLSSEEFLGKGSKLILSRGGTEQILNYLKDGCNDCYWNLYWIGDLDKDGKLDFYLDLSWHYNVSDKKLFLSSQAEKGKLVKAVANFITTGC